MAVVWRSSRGQKRDFVLAREGCNERIEPFLEFGRDEILSIFGAEDRVDVILGIGNGSCALGGYAQDNRFGAAPPALGSSSDRYPALPGWADFGVRPSGPGFRLLPGEVGYLSRAGRC
jgi:hypothetical protein